MNWSIVYFFSQKCNMFIKKLDLSFCHFFNQTTTIMFNTNIGIYALREYEICVTIQEYLLTV